MMYAIRLVVSFLLLHILCGPAVGMVVVDAYDRPVPGVDIQAIQSECGSDTSIIAGTVTSDPEGKFDFTSTKEDAWLTFVSYAPGSYLGWVEESEFVPSDFQPQVEPSKRKLVLHPVETVSGMVTDQQGKPLANVRVNIKFYSYKPKARWTWGLSADIMRVVGVVPDSTTDADGRYVFKDVPVGATTIVVASADGYAMKETKGHAAGDLIEMVPEGTISGKVVDAKGSAVPGARVSCYSSIGFGDVDVATPREPAPVAQDGTFVLKALSPGRYRISAASGGGSVLKPEEVEVKSGAAVALAPMVIHPYVTISGKVICGNPNTALDGISLYAYSTKGGGHGSEATTDEDGSFTLKTMPGETSLVLTDLPEGYQSGFDFKRIVVPDAGLDGFEIQLTEADIGKGMVVDGAGNPVEGATVTTEWGNSKSAATGPDGVFSITLSSEPDDDDNVVLSAKDKTGEHAAKLETKRQALIGGTAVIKLKPTRSLSIEVTGSSGEPIPGAQIAVTEHLSNHFSTTGQPLTCDDSGKCTLNNLIQGFAYSFSAGAEGYFDVGAKRNRVTIGPDTPNKIAIVLSRANRVQTGKVIDEMGRPASSIEVRMESRGSMSSFDRMSPTTVTDAQGRFTLNNMPDAPVTLYASTENAHGSATVSKYTGPVTIQLVTSERDEDTDW